MAESTNLEEWYYEKLKSIEEDPDYQCEKAMIKVQEIVVQQAKRITQLESALEKYGCHLSNCDMGKPTLWYGGEISEMPCSCGFEQVLGGRKEG